MRRSSATPRSTLCRYLFDLRLAIPQAYASPGIVAMLILSCFGCPHLGAIIISVVCVAPYANWLVCTLLVHCPAPRLTIRKRCRDTLAYNNTQWMSFPFPNSLLYAFAWKIENTLTSKSVRIEKDFLIVWNEFYTFRRNIFGKCEWSMCILYQLIVLMPISIFIQFRLSCSGWLAARCE